MISPQLKQEIESTFTVVREKSTADELVILCVECGDRSGHRGINLKTGKTFCFRCNKGKHSKGSFIAWARALGYRFTASDSASGIPVEELLYSNPEAESHSRVPLVKPVSLPKGFTPLHKDPWSVYARLIEAMARRKHLAQADLVEAGVGFTRDDPVWEPFAIFPVMEYDTCVYYQGRTYTDPVDQPTKRFPNRSAVPHGASCWVYNIDAARKPEVRIVVVLESILNVLSLRRKLRELNCQTVAPVCVFKHALSRVQVLKLLRCCTHVREFCILFDHDAIDATWQSIASLSNKVAVSIAEMPASGGNKKCDANDDVEAAIRAIENRKLYTAATATAHLLDEPARARGDVTGKTVL